MSAIRRHDPACDDRRAVTGLSVEVCSGQVGTVDSAPWEADAARFSGGTGPRVVGRKVLPLAGRGPDGARAVAR